MKRYQKLFYRHVEEFLLNHNPNFSPSVMLAVSGGVDSMLLLEWACWLKEQGRVGSLRVVTVHHKTRPGQDQDIALVTQRARTLGLEYVVVEREDAGPKDELSLREFRYQKLFSFLRSDEELWMAHHIDDSWEWSQLQMSRSSEVKSVLGIPFKSGPILRPFLCVTKKQILTLARLMNLQWRDDPTNASASYARFLYRENFAPKLALEHPQYLKHYAYRSQRLAEKWGVALKKNQNYDIYRSSSGVLICGDCGEQILIDEIKKISQAHRGSLHLEAQKILKARGTGKRGPFKLSGKVRISLYSGWIWIYSEGFTPPQMPQQMSFQNLTRRQFEQKLQEAKKYKLFWTPFWVVFNPEIKSRNVLVSEAKDALWASLPDNRCVISSAKLLQRWKDPQQTLSLALPW